MVPQPVYMNMADMAAMSSARAAAEAEDGLDLKTPTAEDLGGVAADGGYESPQILDHNGGCLCSVHIHLSWGGDISIEIIPFRL